MDINCLNRLGVKSIERDMRELGQISAQLTNLGVRLVCTSCNLTFQKSSEDSSDSKKELADTVSQFQEDVVKVLNLFRRYQERVANTLKTLIQHIEAAEGGLSSEDLEHHYSFWNFFNKSFSR
jgi:hypothetical protein